MFIPMTDVDKPAKMRPHPVNKTATRTASLHPDKKTAPAKTITSSATFDGIKDNVPTIKCNMLLKYDVVADVS